MLAASGTGPLLPFDLFHGAIGRLGYPITRGELHAVLGDPDLRRLLDRTHPGTSEERFGLFHQTLTDHLTGRPLDEGSPRAQEVHGVLTDTVEELAPRPRTLLVATGPTRC